MALIPKVVNGEPLSQVRNETINALVDATNDRNLRGMKTPYRFVENAAKNTLEIYRDNAITGVPKRLWYTGDMGTWNGFEVLYGSNSARFGEIFKMGSIGDTIGTQNLETKEIQWPVVTTIGTISNDFTPAFVPEFGPLLVVQPAGAITSNIVDCVYGSAVTDSVMYSIEFTCAETYSGKMTLRLLDSRGETAIQAEVLGGPFFSVGTKLKVPPEIITVLSAVDVRSVSLTRNKVSAEGLEVAGDPIKVFAGTNGSPHRVMELRQYKRKELVGIDPVTKKFDAKYLPTISSTGRANVQGYEPTQGFKTGDLMIQNGRLKRLLKDISPNFIPTADALQDLTGGDGVAGSGIPNVQDYITSKDYMAGDLVKQSGKLKRFLLNTPANTPLASNSLEDLTPSIDNSPTIPNFDLTAAYSKGDMVLSSGGTVHVAFTSIAAGTSLNDESKWVNLMTSELLGDIIPKADAIDGFQGVNPTVSRTDHVHPTTPANIPDFSMFKSYRPGDVVKNPLGNFVRLKGPTANAPSSYLASQWETVSDSTEVANIPEFRQEELYQIGDMVIDHKKRPRRNTQEVTQTGLPFNEAQWGFLETPSTHISDFSELKSYDTGDFVINNLKMYRSLVPVTPKAFKESEWVLLSGSSGANATIPYFLTTSSYKMGDLVIGVDNLIYKSTKDVEPSATMNTTTDWSLIGGSGSGSAKDAVPYFSTTATYKKDDMVISLDDGYLYKAKGAVAASSNMNTTVDWAIVGRVSIPPVRLLNETGSVKYKVGDLALNGYDQLMRCIVNTSGAYNSNSWMDVAVRGNSGGNTFNAYRYYATGELITDPEGMLASSLVDQGPSNNYTVANVYNAAKWKKAVTTTGIPNVPAWSNTAVYKIGDVISRGSNRLVRAIVTPTVGTYTYTQWENIFSPTEIVEADPIVWLSTASYKEGALVRDAATGNVFKANGDIPANQTPRVLGEVGATWRIVNKVGGAAVIRDHNSASAYSANDVVLFTGTLYRSIGGSSPKQFLASEWTQISNPVGGGGGATVEQIPMFLSTASYKIGDVVMNPDDLYIYKTFVAQAPRAYMDMPKWLLLGRKGIQQVSIYKEDGSTQYVAGDLALNGYGRLMCAIGDTQGMYDSNAWRDVFSGSSSSAAVFNGNIWYTIGDLITDPDGALAKSNVDQGPANSYTPNVFSASKWTKIAMGGSSIAMVGASSTVAGTAGTVPKPAIGDQKKVLSGNGSWTMPSMKETLLASPANGSQFTPNPLTKYMTIEAVGAGGGAQGYTTPQGYYAASGGGGSGSYMKSVVTTIPTTLTISISSISSNTFLEVIETSTNKQYLKVMYGSMGTSGGMSGTSAVYGASGAAGAIQSVNNPALGSVITKSSSGTAGGVSGFINQTFYLGGGGSTPLGVGGSPSVMQLNIQMPITSSGCGFGSGSSGNFSYNSPGNGFLPGSPHAVIITEYI